MQYFILIFLFFYSCSTAFCSPHDDMSCSECHVNDNSASLVEMGAAEESINWSEVCLGCHANSFTLSSKRGFWSPAGDFFWLQNNSYGTGDSHGHNVIAPKYGLFQESRTFGSPGGTYKNEWLSCVSCHDLHPAKGKKKTYRMLADQGYSPPGSNGFIFKSGAPVAFEPEGFLLTEPERDSNHINYVSGMSEWCANCHEKMAFHANVHPAGSNALMGKTTKFYGSSYSSLMPFESKAVSSETPALARGPGKTDNVMCLTCHRAHASPYEWAVRWNSRERGNSQQYCRKCHFGNQRGNVILAINTV